MFGIPPQHVIGSAVAESYVNNSNGAHIMRGESIGVVDDGPEKAIQIWDRTDRRPILAAGNANANGDLPSLEFATDNQSLSLCQLVNHDDTEREMSCTPGAEDAVPEAKKNEWQIIDMASAWSRVFPFQNRAGIGWHACDRPAMVARERFDQSWKPDDLVESPDDDQRGESDVRHEQERDVTRRGRSTADVRDGVQAYIWGHPMVVMQRSRDATTKGGDAPVTPEVFNSTGQYFAPVNQVASAWGMLGPKFSVVQSGNSDTLYSVTWFDSSDEPDVLHLPDVEILNGQYHLPGITRAS